MQQELKLAVGPQCDGCGNPIDPDTCHCGQATDSHDPWEGHSPVPIGCGCHNEPDWQKIATTCKILLCKARGELESANQRIESETVDRVVAYLRADLSEYCSETIDGVAAGKWRK